MSYTYYVIWKCRLCGELEEIQSSEVDAWKTAYKAGLPTHDNLRAEIIAASGWEVVATHECGSGRMGLADFVGFRREHN